MTSNLLDVVCARVTLVEVLEVVVMGGDLCNDVVRPSLVKKPVSYFFSVCTISASRRTRRTNSKRLVVVQQVGVGYSQVGGVHATVDKAIPP